MAGVPETSPLASIGCLPSLIQNNPRTHKKKENGIDTSTTPPQKDPNTDP